MIREATLEDVPAIVAMGQRFLAETVYRDRLANSPGHMRALAERLVAGEMSAVFVDEIDGALHGMLGLFVFEHPMSGEQVAAEAFWWVDPEVRGRGLQLLRRAEVWARAAGATVLHMIAPTDDVARLYERLRFTRLETTYGRTL